MEVIKYGNFKSIGDNNKKHQIILTHTSRNVENYLVSLRYRFNGKLNRTPNYVITKDGKILQLLENEQFSQFFIENDINKNSIIISLENLGWLEKQPLENYYVNWIGDIYKGDTFSRKWRDFYFWDPYTEKQISSLSLLCASVMEKMNIPKQVIEHNTKINGIEKFEGVVTRSNFNSNFTDVSPAFDFEIFNKTLNNE